MWNAGVDEAQVGIKISRRNINNLIYADDTTLMAESEELNSLFNEGERGEWRSWLKTQHSENQDHGIWSHHFMANRWGNSVNRYRLYFLGLLNHWDGDWSHEIKRCLFLRRKAMAKLDGILKSRDIILPTKVHRVRAMVFPVILYGCESWTIKKAEHQRIDALELWCWRMLLRVSWTARGSN